MANVTDLFFTQAGPLEARPIIFLHAFPLHQEMWSAQMSLLAQSHRVIACDIRGLGRSPVGDGQYTLEMLSDDLIAVMDELQIPSAVWCGMSLGGYIALRAYEKFPQRCQALVLCDTKSEADGNEAKLKRAAAIQAIKSQGVGAFADGFLKGVLSAETFAKKPKVAIQAREMILSNTALGICGLQLALGMRTDTSGVLEKITVPTLIVVGENDATTPPEISRKMHERIRGSILKIIPDAGHMSNLENEEAFNDALVTFDFFV